MTKNARKSLVQEVLRRRREAAKANEQAGISQKRMRLRAQAGIRALRGKIVWEGNFEELRRMRFCEFAVDPSQLQKLEDRLVKPGVEH